MKLLKIFLYTTYFPLIALDIYLIKQYGEFPLFLPLSMIFFLVPTLSLFWKKQVHHIVYRFCEIIFKNSDVNIEYEEDNYKKWDKMCLGILITVYIFLLLEIPYQLFS